MSQYHKFEIIKKNLLSNKFEISPRKNFNWEKVYSNCNNQLVLYESSYIDFRIECLIGNDIECEDLSFGVKLQNDVVAILPLIYFKKGNDFSLSIFDNTICPPIFSNKISKKLEKEISSFIFDILKIIFTKLKVKKPIISDHLTPNKSLSCWHKIIMNQTKKCSIIRESFVDLGKDYNFLKSNYRKSYKALISKGYKLFSPYKFNQIDFNIWGEFKALHFKAAGRKTRSDKSWDILLQQIKENKANFYFCRDQNGFMVGGSLVMVTKDEAFYAIAAYDRDLFHLPIGHFLQDYIIKDLITTKIKWYRLGRLFSKIDFDHPTKKEVQIGQFKSGFSSDLIASYRFTKLN